MGRGRLKRDINIQHDDIKDDNGDDLLDISYTPGSMHPTTSDLNDVVLIQSHTPCDNASRKRLPVRRLDISNRSRSDVGSSRCKSNDGSSSSRHTDASSCSRHNDGSSGSSYTDGSSSSRHTDDSSGNRHTYNSSSSNRPNNATTCNPFASEGLVY